MEFNRITADFYMRGATITELKVDNQIAELAPDMQKRFGLDISDPMITQEEDNYYGDIAISVIVEVESEDIVKSTFELTLNGQFSSSLNTSKEDFERLVMINGASALYGILRSKLETISATVFSDGKILVPFVNVIEFYKARAEEIAKANVDEE